MPKEIMKAKLTLTYEPIYSTFNCPHCDREYDFHLPTYEGKLIPQSVDDEYTCVNCGEYFVIGEVVQNLE